MLKYQKEAIQSVISLFSGMPLDTQDYTHHTGMIGNTLALSSEEIQESLDSLQESLIEKKQIDERSDVDSQGMSFTIEMETGTGKTYVYIRTILELARTYGWKKYIIVVPSLPIKE
jgi:type III restriction enzyme